MSMAMSRQGAKQYADVAWTVAREGASPTLQIHGASVRCPRTNTGVARPSRNRLRRRLASQGSRSLLLLWEMTSSCPFNLLFNTTITASHSNIGCPAATPANTSTSIRAWCRGQRCDQQPRQRRTSRCTIAQQHHSLCQRVHDRRA